ncbi:hypothetical protein L4D09_19620 [Photobacterium makurazakiensis]|uniref:hypothetical protein n=1 Tax=Photobacterium makurazakiensis TaxID=2910234 RepID=UPI003D0FEA9B
MNTLIVTPSSPIHRPCPDMAGCSNPNPELTKNSLSIVRQLRSKFGFKTTEQRTKQHSQYLKDLAAYQYKRDLMVGGAR